MTNPANAEERRNLVLGRMLGQGYITQQEHDEAVATPLAATLHVNPVAVGCQTANGAAFFCDYVTKVITSDPIFGETPRTVRVCSTVAASTSPRPSTRGSRLLPRPR
ncbi:hypothetical protein NKG05_17450 [Oerskovia sp. M15]